MKRLIPLFAIAALVAICAIRPATSQVPGGLWRFGTTGVFAPQAGNCVSILAMNSSGQTGTDSGTPCSPVVLTSAYTNATTGFTSIMALPTVQGGLTLRGECTLIWQGSSTSATPTFAVQASSAPTDLYVLSINTGSAYTAPAYTTITSTTQTAVTGALTTGAATTPYKLSLTFSLINGTSPNTITVYAESNNASYTITVQPGSNCSWIP